MIVLTEEQLEEIVTVYSQFDTFAFDTETLGTNGRSPLDSWTNQVFWLSLAGPGRADVIPMGHPLGRTIQEAQSVTKPGRKTPLKIPAKYADPPTQLWPSQVFSALNQLFYSDRLKIGHNVKFDLESISKYYDGELPPPPYCDTLVVAHLLDENRLVGLDKLTQRHFGYSYEQLGKKGVQKFGFEKAALYSYLDAKYDWLFYWKYRRRLAEQKLEGIFRLEMDNLEACLFMEQEGAPINKKAMEELGHDLEHEMGVIQTNTYKIAGYEFNLNSGPQKANFVYKIRKHKPTMFTGKTGAPSTAAAALEPLAAKDPAIAALIEHSSLQTLYGTFVKGMMELLNPDDGRLHANFKQCGTVTGRYSCDRPNLQNIPRENSGTSAKLRSMFRAPKGYKLIVADYDQIEKRITGHHSQDPVLLEVFQKGQDIHAATAAQLLECEIEDVNPEERTLYGKNVNFAADYGAGPYKLSAMSDGNITVAQATDFLEDLKVKFAGVERLRRGLIKTARKRKPPYIKTLLGRRRRIPELNSPDFKTRSRAERQLFNSLIQGGSADILKLAMVRLHIAFLDTPAQMIMTVHDELISLCPDSFVDEAIELQEDAMQIPNLLRNVPLTVKAHAGQTWSEAKG